MPQSSRESYDEVEDQRSPGDALLIQECLNGKESAWAALINRYKSLIFSIPVRKGLSREDAADIFQAVCMELLAGLPRLREQKTLPAWLVQVTRNKCFHRMQDLQRMPTQEVENVERFARADEPENLLSLVQREQHIRNTIGKLPNRCQQLLTMLFFETPARPYQEVASDLRIAPGSIGFIRNRCLQKLRNELESVDLRLA